MTFTDLLVVLVLQQKVLDRPQGDGASLLRPVAEDPGADAGKGDRGEVVREHELERSSVAAAQLVLFLSPRADGMDHGFE